MCSPARRARETAALAAEGSGRIRKTAVEPRLYEGGANACLEVLRGLPAGADRILLVGHNPALREAAAALLGCLPECLRLPPAALACLEAPVDGWDRLEPGSCTLQWLATPELAAAFQRRPPPANKD